MVLNSMPDCTDFRKKRRMPPRYNEIAVRATGDNGAKLRGSRCLFGEYLHQAANRLMSRGKKGLS
jgi:hypothetical protein